jgi:hypothetical protein
VGVPVTVGTPQEYAQNFGPVMARTYDMGTYVAIGSQQGASQFKCVRVTDGSDVAATGKFGTTDITFTAKYTGSLGNQITVSIAPGSVASAWNVTVSNPTGGLPETFSNITGTGNAFWENIANAINNGQNAFRGPSHLITCVAGAGTDAPTAESVTLSGGVDGVTSVTGATLVGSDVAPRKGMYALRRQGCSVGVLCDCSTSTQWSVMASFGLQEGIYFMDAFPASAGDPAVAISTNIATLQTSGAASYALKIMHGDWLTWYDQQNQVYRLVSPAAFAAGLRANTSPQNSNLNQQIFGIVGSQKSGAVNSQQAGSYTSADLAQLFAAGIDVIGNPSPGGNYWSCLSGYNTAYAVNQAIGRDTYTTMTNYLAATLNAGMGVYIGLPITPSLMQRVTATLTQFLNTMVQQGLLAMTVDANGNSAQPFSVVCNNTNNPFARTSQGYLQADVQVQYMATNEKFIINLQGGQTVQVSIASQQQTNS